MNDFCLLLQISHFSLFIFFLRVLYYFIIASDDHQPPCTWEVQWQYRLVPINVNAFWYHRANVIVVDGVVVAVRRRALALLSFAAFFAKNAIVVVLLCVSCGWCCCTLYTKERLPCYKYVYHFTILLFRSLSCSLAPIYSLARIGVSSVVLCCAVVCCAVTLL